MSRHIDYGKDIYAKQKNTLQELLDWTVGGMDRVVSVKMNMTDPHVLIVKAAEGL